MDKELSIKFNEEVHRYRNALLFHAKQSEWDIFKSNAGSLFDYIESIEMSEFKRRFVRVMKILSVVLLFMVAVIWQITVYPELEKVKDVILLLSIAGCCFGVYFFFNFRIYLKSKVKLYEKRKQKFIREVENDFREMTVSIAA